MESILAGMMIALAALMYLMIAPVNKLVAAFFFSIGLLTILIYKFALFTGKAGKLGVGDISPYELMKIWIGNFIGVVFIGMLAINWAPAALSYEASAIADARIMAEPMKLLTGGIFCGMLMYIATAAQTPLWLSIMCVMAFIWSGFYHCVADMAYFLLAQEFYLVDVVQPLSLVTLGNLIGCNVIPVLQKYTVYEKNRLS